MARDAHGQESCPPNPSALSMRNRLLTLAVLAEDLGGDVHGAPATFCTLDLPDLDRLLDAARVEGRAEMSR